MEEKAELLKRSSSNNRKSYGSVPKLAEPSEEERPPRCLCTKRDCILVSILSVLVATAIIVSLAIGIPKIQSKQQQYRIDGQEGPLLPTPGVLSSPTTEYKTSAAEPSITTSPRTKTGANLPPISNSDGTDATVPENSTANTANGPVVLRQSALYKRAAVSADDARCAEIGSNVLRENGSAVDAAISALLCMEAVNPQHSGIGGGFFMLIYSRKENKTYAIDARETAPAKASKNMLLNSSGLLVAVPGVIKGMSEAHKQFGRNAWSSLFQPTIDLCTNGYSVNSALADALQDMKNIILQETSLNELFFNNTTGDVLCENETLKRPGLARTLQIIATEGEKEFYAGTIAKQLVNDIQAKGGIITLEDMSNYTIKIKEPVISQLKGTQLHLHTMPPPSSGALLPLVLNLLSSYKMNDAKDLTDRDYTQFLQRLAESYKFGSAIKAQLGDDQFVNVTEIVASLTSSLFALDVKRYIKDNTTYAPEYYLSRTSSMLLPPSDQGTTHVNVFTNDGDVVSVTNTINNRFGAKFRSRSLDIVLNDEMNDFSFSEDALPSTANSVAPGKRPLSSMMPTIVFDESGKPLLAVGGSGGSAIFTSVANVMAHHLILNETMEDAILAPRMHHKLVPNVLEMESSFPVMFIDALDRIGHNISLIAPQTHVNAVHRTSDGMLEAVGDPRIAIGIAGV